MTVHTISEDTLNKILAYLGTKSYVEVFGLVNAITADIQNNTKLSENKAEETQTTN